MSLNKRIGPMSALEIKEQRELYKSFREKVLQLRMPPVQIEPENE